MIDLELKYLEQANLPDEQKETRMCTLCNSLVDCAEEYVDSYLVNSYRRLKSWCKRLHYSNLLENLESKQALFANIADEDIAEYLITEID